MSSHSIRNSCPPTCPKVKEQIRNAIEKAPWLLDEIFPRKENDVHRRLWPEVSKDIQDRPKRVTEVYDHEVPIDHRERIETDVPSKTIADIIETRPIREQEVIQKDEIVQELSIIQEQTIIPTEKIADRDNEKIDFIEEKKLTQEPEIIEEQIVIPIEKIVDRDEEKIDLIGEKELAQEVIIQDQIVTPTEEIADRDEKKVDLIEGKKLDQIIIDEQIAIPMEKIVDHDVEKIDLIEEKKLDQTIIDEQIAIPMKKIADHDVEKIDLIEEKDLVEKIVGEPAKEVPIAIEEPKVVEDEIDRAAAAEVELEPSEELEEYLPVKVKERVEYDEEEEGITDYEKFIDEELQETLPVVIAKEIPEVPKAMRREISRNAAILYEGIDRERPVELPREVITAIPEERPTGVELTAIKVLANSVTTEDVCDETCPLVKEQKERIMRKLKERQRVVDRYYLTKGSRYFEDVCTCSLACMVYTLSRDPFVRSVFASLALFAVGLKLCSELDAWEISSHIS